MGMNWTLLVAISDAKTSPIFTDLKIQACKTFIALATGQFCDSSLINFCHDSSSREMKSTWVGIVRYLMNNH